MKEFPLVSIIVPVYGVEKYIEKCARSIFEQTYDNLEFFFVDDCSPDRSVDILLNVLEDYPERKNQFRLERFEKNKGLAAVRNYQYKNCKGDFLYVLDSDDWIELDTIEKLVKKQQEKDADVVVADMMVHLKTNSCINHNCLEIEKEKYLVALLRGKTSQYLCGRLVRKELIIKNHIEAREGANVGEDWQVTPLLIYYSRQIDFLPEPFYNYNRLNENSHTHQQGDFNKFEKMRRGTIASLEILSENFSKIAPQYCEHIKHTLCWLIYDLHIVCCKQGKRSSFNKVKEDYRKYNYLPYITAETNNKLFSLIGNNYYALRLLFNLTQIKQLIS